MPPTPQPSVATSLARFFRLEYLSFGLLLPLLGTATVATAAPIPLGRSLAILATALALHVHINLMNDVCDLPIDRRHPGRQKYPLVRGVIKRWQAAAIALLAAPVAFALTWVQHGPVLAHVALASVMSAIGVYNLWGKRFIFPPLTDLALGIGYASITLWGATMIGVPARLTWIVFAWVVAWTLQINLLGGLRDLHFDRSSGARTTPIVFGTMTHARGLAIPRLVRAYEYAIEALLLGLPLLALWQNDFDYTPTTRALLAVALTLLESCTLATLLLFIRLAERDPKTMREILFIPIGLTCISMVLLLAPNPNRWLIVVVTVSYFLPLSKLLKRRRAQRSKIIFT
jgi:4-hydroxybenzoate polyprenyltransferase